MTEKQTKPAIRYAEFTDAWEQREFATLVSRKSILCSESNLPRVEYEDVVSGLGQLNKDVNDKVCNKTGFLFESNDILFGKLRPYLCNWLLSSFKGIAVGDWWVLHPNETCPAFIYALIQSDKFKNISNVSTGTKMPRSDWSIVSKTIFKIPPDLTEQSIIGDIFCNLDHLITLHQREYDKVLSIKKAMLEKMFPKNGEDKPEIRFAGFTDAWEQRKLGDIVQITMGQSPDGSTYSDVPSDYILVQGNADLDNGWVKPRIWTTQKTKTADAGDLIMSVRAPAGSMGKTGYDIVIGRGVSAIKGNEFLFQLLTKLDLDGFWKAFSCGSTFDSLNSDNIINALISVPKPDEQIIIGQYFERLDNLITLHQRELRMLQNIKKGLLEKMFVPG